MHATLSILLTQGGGHEAAGGGTFEPFFPGLVILLPLLGFVINGVLGVQHLPTRSAALLP